MSESKLKPIVGSIVISLPFLFASAMILIVMILLGVPLDISTAIIGAMAINVASDFSIYIVHSYTERIFAGSNHDQAISFAMREKGGIVLADMVLNSICFLPLMISSFVPVARLGWMMATMLVFAAIGSLIIMPPLLRYAIKKDAKN